MLKKKGASCWFSICSLPEFMNFKLFGKTILVVDIKFGLFWAIHSASEYVFPQPQKGTLKKRLTFIRLRFILGEF